MAVSNNTTEQLMEQLTATMQELTAAVQNLAAAQQLPAAAQQLPAAAQQLVQDIMANPNSDAALAHMAINLKNNEAMVALNQQS
jgi:hypothetical protein